MSESNPPITRDPVPALPYASPQQPGGQPKLLRLGGALGASACFVGLAILVAACAGMDAAFKMSFIPLLLGSVGFVLALVGATVEKAKITEDTHVLAALFAACLGIIGGLVEIAAWQHWQLFH